MLFERVILKTNKRRKLTMIWTLLITISLLWIVAVELMRAKGTESGHDFLLVINEVLMLETILLPVVSAVFATRLVQSQRDSSMFNIWKTAGVSELRVFVANANIGSILSASITFVNLLGALLIANFFGFQHDSRITNVIVIVVILLIGASVSNAFFQTAIATCFEQSGITIGTAVVGALVTSAFPFLGYKMFGMFTPWSLIGALNPIAPVSEQVPGQQVLLSNLGLIAVAFSMLATCAWLMVSIGIIKIKRGK